METIIGKNLDFTLIGDSFEDLKYKKYKSERSCYELSGIRIAEDEGEYIKRPIVFDSPELLAVILEIKEQVAAYKEEQSGKDEPCECKEPCSNLKRV